MTKRKPQQPDPLVQALRMHAQAVQNIAEALFAVAYVLTKNHDDREHVDMACATAAHDFLEAGTPPAR